MCLCLNWYSDLRLAQNVFSSEEYVWQTVVTHGQGFSLSEKNNKKKRISDQSITCCCARYKVILPTNLVLCEHIISPIPAELPSMLYGCKWGCFSFCPAVSPMWLELMSLCQLCIYLNYSVFILFSFLGKISLQCR